MTKAQLLDLAERAGWTFVQAAAAIIITSQGFGAEVWKAAAVAGGLAVAKAVVAIKTTAGGKPDAALPSPPTAP